MAENHSIRLKQSLSQSCNDLMTGSPTYLINLTNQMNSALPNYLILIMKCQTTQNRLHIPHLALGKVKCAV